LKPVEIQAGPGEHISSAIERMIAQAPSYCVFNDTRVEALPGETPDEIYARWTAERARAQAEYERSDEYRKREQERQAEIDRDNALVSKALISLGSLDFQDLGAVLAWIDRIADATDHRGVYKDELIDRMTTVFAEHGLLPDMNLGDAFDAKDRDNVARYLIGQALSFLAEPPYAIHGVWHSLYREWMSKHESAG
jgi:hypothetical protein